MEQKKRGRPAIENPLTNAERQRRYRQKLKAELAVSRENASQNSGHKIKELENEIALLKNRFTLEIDREKKKFSEELQREKVRITKNKEIEIHRLLSEIASLKGKIKTLETEAFEFKTFDSAAGKAKKPNHASELTNKKLIEKIRRLCHPDKHGNSDLSNSVTAELNKILK